MLRAACVKVGAFDVSGCAQMIDLRNPVVQMRIGALLICVCRKIALPGFTKIVIENLLVALDCLMQVTVLRRVFFKFCGDVLIVKSGDNFVYLNLLTFCDVNGRYASTVRMFNWYNKPVGLDHSVA